MGANATPLPLFFSDVNILSSMDCIAFCFKYANYSGKKIKLHPFLYVFTEKRHFFLSIISI